MINVRPGKQTAADGQRHFASSAELCAHMLDIAGPTCLLAFSRGKDAISAWLQLRSQGFTRIVPFYMSLVPGMQFEERSLRYYERWFGTPIYRMTNPAFVRMLRNNVFQAPEHVIANANAGLHGFTHEDICDYIRQKEGLPSTVFVATGVRANDSLTRRRAIRKWGPINYRRRSFFPVFDFSMDQLVAQIAGAGVKLPVDYRLWGRTFDGIDFRFLAALRERFPADYAAVLKWFPLADMEFFRRRMQ